MDDKPVEESDIELTVETTEVQDVEPVSSDAVTPAINTEPASVIEPPEPEPVIILDSTTEPAAPVEYTPEPPKDSNPEPVPTPADLPTPSTLKPIPSSTPSPLKPEPTPEPPLTTHPSPLTATFDVSSLSDAQLKEAATLYTKRNQAELAKKGVAKRQQTMELNLREIIDFLSHNNGSPLPRIAKHTNITPGTTSKYLRQLIAKDKITATGWGNTRRYFLK